MKFTYFLSVTTILAFSTPASAMNGYEIQDFLERVNHLKGGMTELKEKAQKGDINATVKLAGRYKKIAQRINSFIKEKEEENSYLLNKSKKKFEKAEQLYKQANDKQHPQALFKLWKMYIEKKDLEKAFNLGETKDISVMLEFTERLKKPWAWDVQLAVNFYEKLYEQANNDQRPQILIKLVKKYLANHDLEKAFNLCENEVNTSKDISLMLKFAEIFEENYKPKFAISFYKKAAKENDVFAMIKLGDIYGGETSRQNCYRFFHDFPRDINKAGKYYKKASLLGGKTKGLYKVAYLLLPDWSEYNQENENKAIEYLEIAAQQRSEKAYLKLAELYEKKFDNKEMSNNDKAIQYYEKAKELGSLRALSRLSRIYNKGIGVKQDESIALQYAEEGKFLTRENNSIRLYALFDLYSKNLRLRYFYFSHLTVQKDENKAIQYLEESLKGGNKEALEELLRRAPSRAIQYLEEKGKQGDTNALTRVYKLYSEGTNDVEKDENKAIQYLEESVKEGNEDALYELLRRAPSRAIQYLEEKGEQGDTKALNKIYNLYSKGEEHIEKNKNKAIQYLEKQIEWAIKSNEIYRLARFFSILLKKNPKKSIEYYEKVIDLIKKTEKYCREEYFKWNGTDYYSWEGDWQYKLFKIYMDEQSGVQQNSEKAMEYLKEAAKLQNNDALNELGKFFMKGKHGFEKNLSHALTCYTLAGNTLLINRVRMKMDSTNLIENIFNQKDKK